MQQNFTETFTGIVKRVTFHSVESGWSVLKVVKSENDPDEVAVTVHQSKVFAGATMKFTGTWSNHPKFGLQFKAEKAEELQPASAGAIEKYLGSGLIKGVGPATAKKIVEHFKEQTLEVFDKEIDRLTEVPGIAKNKLKMIVKAWDEHKDIKDVMIFLQSHEISTLFAVKIYKSYGKDSIKIVSENPYKLAQDIYGIGFFSADKVALSLGFEESSDKRINAAIRQVLAASREEGHCYLTIDQIIKGVNELLSNDLTSKIEPLLLELEKQNEFKTRLLTEENTTTKCYYANSVYFDESYIAKRMRQMISQKIPLQTDKLEDWVSKYCELKKISLSDEQASAVISVVQERFSILTGGPGCGKTTTTKVIVKLLQALKKHVLLAAPTGRASQRMTEVIGLQATTIHRLLKWQPDKGGFEKNELDTLETDFLIIDETSMLDVHLAAALLRAVNPKTQVLFIGDSDQLPSVGAGNILKDLINSEKIRVFALTKVFRQAQESLIIRYAHQINKGQLPEIDTPFKNPELWKNKQDCMFIDSEEATQDQVKFINKVHYLAEKRATYNVGTENLDKEIEITDKFKHVDIDRLILAENRAEELKEVVKKVHPWSSLNYGLSATDLITKIYKESIPKYFGRATEIQILTPMTKGTLGTVNLNKIIQKAINPTRFGVAELQLGERIFRVGDRVIQKKNNYDLEVFNGDIGKISQIDNEEMLLTVEYSTGDEIREVVYERESLAEIDLAYAITIHKSQGSEFGAVIIPVTMQHFNMLFRNLIYTGLTRAKKLAVFIGSRKALAMSISNTNSAKRQTTLEWLLRNEEK